MRDINLVKKKYNEGGHALGTYVTLSPTAVELAALAGFDFVRMDPYHNACSPEMLSNFFRAAYAHGVQYAGPHRTAPPLPLSAFSSLSCCSSSLSLACP